MHTRLQEELLASAWDAGVTVIGAIHQLAERERAVVPGLGRPRRRREF